MSDMTVNPAVEQSGAELDYLDDIINNTQAIRKEADRPKVKPAG